MTIILEYTDVLVNIGLKTVLNSKLLTTELKKIETNKEELIKYSFNKHQILYNKEDEEEYLVDEELALEEYSKNNRFPT